jgi:hypothetical protein
VRSSPARALLLLAFLLLLASTAHAAPSAALLDTTCHYGYGDTLTVIWKPLATLPELARPGDTLTVWASAPAAPTTWSASLRLAALSVPLTPAGGAFQANLGWWVLGFRVPSGVPEELYDLILSSSTGLLDTTRHSVKVLPAFRGDYYFAQISDTHLPEHSFSPSFSTCDTTGMADFDAVIADLNLIHPEFILHTGDLVNEGELEEYYNDYEMGRAQRMVYRLRDPMFLSSGNHDIGGWTPTPPPPGTSRKNWWRYFGWPFLGSPPPGAPYHTQNYTFDYDSLRVIALEAYLNNGSYDNYQTGTYGGGSFTPEQITWLDQQIAAAGPRHKLVMYHFDFDQGANTGSTSGPWQLNIASLGVDGAIWGHDHSVPENTVTPRTAHPFNLGCQAVIDGKRTFRIFRVHNGNLSPGPMHHSGTNTDSLSASWSGPNDGTRSRLSVTVNNQFGETWDHARLVFILADHDSDYAASGGTVAQAIRLDGVVNVYVDCVLPASGIVNVSVAPSTPVAGVAAAHPSRLALGRPSPNPLGPRSRRVSVSYTLPTAGPVELGVFDLSGRRVAMLVHGGAGPGAHSAAIPRRRPPGVPSPLARAAPDLDVAVHGDDADQSAALAEHAVRAHVAARGALVVVPVRDRLALQRPRALDRSRPAVAARVGGLQLEPRVEGGR